MNQQPEKVVQLDLLLLLARLFRFLWRRKWVVLAIGVLSLILAYVVGYRHPNYIYSMQLSTLNSVLNTEQITQLMTGFRTNPIQQPRNIRSHVLEVKCKEFMGEREKDEAFEPNLITITLSMDRPANPDSITAAVMQYFEDSPFVQEYMAARKLALARSQANYDSVIALSRSLFEQEYRGFGSTQAQGVFVENAGRLSGVTEFIQLLDSTNNLKLQLDLLRPTYVLTPCTLPESNRLKRTVSFFLGSFFALLLVYLLGEGIRYLIVDYPHSGEREYHQ
ncbi:MAG: hypothetical protein AL399_07700 [Candidatus [Bacteroides] periocalifornicus]|uniref:Polysaccharide chain length determinant N-terminal domain-containing protein n=1 Tax=Candidatus [Bacteroides] periocalifornicus TaxID=1702214 RepID=A0A0Q4B354_9BACT|nr:MAG: hypothetical protein AL399_07700 [Candidatus [Bacteroides] periocalifornicus]